MAITIDKRYLRGPLSFSCNYHGWQEKKDVYSWLVNNFGGKYPDLQYNCLGTNNGRWHVNDNFLLSYHGIGGFTVRFQDELDAIAFKLRWI